MSHIFGNWNYPLQRGLTSYKNQFHSGHLLPNIWFLISIQHGEWSQENETCSNSWNPSKWNLWKDFEESWLQGYQVSSQRLCTMEKSSRWCQTYENYQMQVWQNIFKPVIHILFKYLFQFFSKNVFNYCSWWLKQW